MSDGMERWSRILPALRLPLGMFAVVALAAASLAGFSWHRECEAQRALQAQYGRLAQARQRSVAASAERAAAASYQPLFRRLVQQGFVGAERRSEWIDDLRAASRQHPLFGIAYSIGAQQDYRPRFLASPAAFSLRRSEMNIDIPLLHENDLLAMLDGMRADRRAMFQPRDCVMTRLEDGPENGYAPRLAASCRIDWLTLTGPRRAEARP